MKLSQDQIQEAQKIQILSNSIRLQVLLEVLVDLDILDVKKFNDLVEKKYTDLNKEIISDAKKSHEEHDEYDVNDINKIIKYFGPTGDA